MRRLTRAVVTVAVTLITVALGVLGIVWTGAYDVSATSGHTDAVRWALNTLQHSSVGARAEPLEGGLPRDSAALNSGFHHFDEMCVTCHGAPGVGRSEIGRGMTPTPPSLAEEAPEWSDGELVRITAEGIKLAGMPAFGPTHSDAEIREIVAFVRLLPRMDSATYAGWRARAGGGRHEEGGGTGASGAGHTHPPGASHDDDTAAEGVGSAEEGDGGASPAPPLDSRR